MPHDSKNWWARWRRSARAVLLALGLCLATPAFAGRVAVTFDDLPVFGRTASTVDAREVTDRLLAALRRNHIPAIGFVNEGKLAGPDREASIAMLRAWIAAGEQLGNHGYRHLSLTNTPLDAYLMNIEDGEKVTRPLLLGHGGGPVWFRPPYLETGTTAEAKAGFQAWLIRHGYRVAPVTMENLDWAFALAYDDAVIRRDEPEAARILAAYVAFTARIVPWYKAAAQAVLGRQPAYVFLLHASRLNADAMDQIAAIFRREKLSEVPLAAALRDKAYAIPDDHIGPDGDQWLTRWARTLHKDMPWSTLPTPPADIVARSVVLDRAARP